MKNLKKSLLVFLVLCLSCAMMPVMAAGEVEAPISLLKNGDFEAGVQDWTILGYDGDTTELLNTLMADEGNYSLSLPAGSVLRQDVALSGDAVYRLTFRMRSTTAGGIRLIFYYHTNSGLFNKSNFPNIPESDVANDWSGKQRGYFGLGGDTWHDVSYDISIPASDLITMLRLDFDVQNNDGGVIVDKFSFVKISDKCNYAWNGEVENKGTSAAVTSWAGYDLDKTEGGSDSGYFLSTETGGNQFLEFRQSSSENSADWAGGNAAQTMYIAPGRYKFSADIKGPAAGTARIAFDPNNGDARALWDSYGTLSRSMAGVSIETEWTTQEVYFTIPAQAGQTGDAVVYLYLPIPSRFNTATRKHPTAYFDNIKIERIGEPVVEFADVTYRKYDKQVEASRAIGKIEKLSDIGAGNALPIAGMYVPTTAGDAETPGISETVQLAATLYKDMGEGKKRLTDIVVLSGSTDVTTDTLNGATAGSIVVFDDSINLPEDLDATYSAKLMLWKPGMSPVCIREMNY
ncbi:MAG: hypothetical protein E7390_02775 [Ruminococcaceae bacterium]|nr:hypothetical protein [Oscillospiraceae bacterium]